MFGEEYTNEEANKTISTFVNNQLIPNVEELENLAVAMLRFRVDIFGLIYRHRLNTLQQSFRDKAKQFLTLYGIYSDPDKLFADLKLDPQKDQKKIATLKVDYFQSKDLVGFHMKRGFRMVELLQRQLDQYHRSADQRMAVFLSIIATFVSVTSILFSYLY